MENNNQLAGYSPERPQVDKVRYTHEAMIDLMISNPGISQNAIAKHFGYSASWVCTILASDAFQMQLAARRHELVDPQITASIEERFKALANASVDRLLEHLTQPAVQSDPEVMIKAAALGAKALGLGGNAPQKQIVISTDDRLNNLSSKLTHLLKQAHERGIVDVLVTEKKEDPNVES